MIFKPAPERSGPGAQRCAAGNCCLIYSLSSKLFYDWNIVCLFTIILGKVSQFTIENLVCLFTIMLGFVKWENNNNNYKKNHIIKKNKNNISIKIVESRKRITIICE